MIIRQAVPDDCTAMAGLLNSIIRIGGTTAFEVEKTAYDICDWYLTGQFAVCCHVAWKGNILLGYQSLSVWEDLPDGWGDIGTFVQPGLQRSGVGAALFDHTRTVAQTRGFRVINATIRADNVPGLGYYTRRGFIDYGAEPAFALSNGQLVGRILKRFDLG